MNASTLIKWIPAALLVLSSQVPIAHAHAQAHAQAQAQAPSATGSAMSEKLHANALASFRQGRFSEAYGRLIQLADAGHAPSADMALWMYLHGTTVFGKDWDSTPEQLKSWAQTAGQPVQAMVPRTYPHALVTVSDRKR